MSMWWEACKTTRRVSQATRKEYQQRKEQTETTPDTQEESNSIALEDWFGQCAEESEIDSD